MEGIAKANWIAYAAETEGTKVRSKGFLKLVRWRSDCSRVMVTTVLQWK